MARGAWRARARQQVLDLEAPRHQAVHHRHPVRLARRDELQLRGEHRRVVVAARGWKGRRGVESGARVRKLGLVSVTARFVKSSFCVSPRCAADAKRKRDRSDAGDMTGAAVGTAVGTDVGTSTRLGTVHDTWSESSPASTS